MFERAFLLRENLSKRMRPFVDEKSSWEMVTDDTDVVTLLTVDLHTDKCSLPCSCVTVSFLLSSGCPLSSDILVTVVLVIVVRVDTELDSVTVATLHAFDGGGIFIWVETTDVVVVVEVVTCVIVLGCSVTPLLLFSVKSSLRLDSSAEGTGDGAILMIFTTELVSDD